MQNSLSEKTIEDILSSDRTILSDILRLNANELSLVARQKTLPSGILDLLYLHRNELLLIELKVVPFYSGIISQINGYFDDLVLLQRNNRMINADIKKIVLVTGCSRELLEKCSATGINVLIYYPESVLGKFYENFKELTQFFKLRAGDFGVVRLALLNKTLTLLNEGMSLIEIGEVEKRSIKTLKNRFSVASLVNLVVKFKGRYYLTDLGNEFINSTIAGYEDRLSETQSELLSRFVMENPFYSSITYAIFTLIESIFYLSRSTYPVPFDDVVKHFVQSVGKESTWRTDKARITATYIFSNYAIELGFISKVNNGFYVNPMGVRAILILQLKRSIRLIESQH